MMKTLKFISIAAASTLALGAAVATPTMAQPWGPPAIVYDRPLTTSYVDSLDWRINNAARMGEISWNQAANLRAQLRMVQPIAFRVETGLATRGEYRRLARVVDRIERMTHVSYASRRAPPYAYGYGWRR